MATCRVLSLDGGGLRGIIPAVWLEELERRLANAGKGTVREHFDFIVGASTGSIIALGLAARKSPREIRELFEANAEVIFPQDTWWVRRTGILGPKYSREGLETVLRSAFGTLRLGDLDKRVMVPAYDMKGNRPVFFKSWQKAYKTLPVWQIAAASSSGPTYFAPTRAVVDDRFATLIDGGVVMNNPVAAAVAEALYGKGVFFRVGKNGAGLRVLSLGTGAYTPDNSYQEVAERGAWGWISSSEGSIVDILFDASSDSMTYLAEAMLRRRSLPQLPRRPSRRPGSQKLVRWQVELPKELGEMADSSAYALSYWCQAARGLLSETQVLAELGRIVQW